MAKEYNYDIGCVPSTFWFGFVGSNILVPIIALLSGIKVKPDREFLKAEGPIIVIANHESFLDPMVTSRLTHGRKVNFVCGEFLFRKHFWGHVFKLGGAIPKKQFAVDTSAVKAMMKVMKRNGVLVIYPEATRHVDGHTTDRFDDGVAKFAKKAGASIYVQHIHGAYLTMPRWCSRLRIRRGRISSEFVRVITREEISSMTVEELDREIKSSIDYDENEWARQSGIRFGSKKLAEGLNNIAYRCPCCDVSFALKWDGNNSIICDKCKTAYEYHPDGTITYKDKAFDLHKWTEWEKKRIEEGSITAFSSECEVFREKDQFTFEKVDEGTFLISNGEIRFLGSEEIRYNTSRLRGMVCKYGSNIEIYDSKGGLTRFVLPGDKIFMIQQMAELSHE